MGEEKLEQAAASLARARHVACLTGSGISAESGIATFRDAQTGLWSKFDPQQLASQAGFAANPALVWRWYMDRLDTMGETSPNPGHVALATLETLVPEFTLITQNVDGMHERAGTTQAIHLHGSINRFRCNACHRAYALQPQDRRHDLPPICPKCGGPIRPAVVWFGETLPKLALERAWRAAETCDVMLVIGTSGVVFPAAQLPFVAAEAGATLIDVNVESTEISARSNIFLQGKSGTILPELVLLVENER